MRHERGANPHRWVALALVAPTAFVAAVWIASGFVRGARIGAPAAGAWDWRLRPNYVVIEATGAPTPVNALPPGTVPASWGGPPYNGVSFRGGGSYFFGWFGHSRGHYFRGTQATPSRIVSVSLVVPLILALPLAWVGARVAARPSLHERRRQRGLCPSCGYDTRASPQRCPECGHTGIAAAAPGAA